MTSFDWKNKKIIVTGGHGFLGSYVVKKLKERECSRVFVPRSENYNLVEMEDVRKLYRDQSPQIVIHLAAQVGGIGANQANPGKFFYTNLMMGTQMMEVCRQSGLEKFVAIGTVCAYPKLTPVPFREESLWDGYPEETNAPYGLAKKMLMVMSQTYREQYKFNSIYLLPVNLYGPGDNFDLNTSHVIPAMIRKYLEAIEKRKQEVVLWGTGKPHREFLYVEDAAEGILLATERFNSSQPVNLGTGTEISIHDLAEMIAQIVGFKGKIVWDLAKPDGQPRRCLDTSKAEKEFGFKAKTKLKEGLVKTIESYKLILQQKPLAVE